MFVLNSLQFCQCGSLAIVPEYLNSSSVVFRSGPHVDVGLSLSHSSVLGWVPARPNRRRRRRRDMMD